MKKVTNKIQFNGSDVVAKDDSTVAFREPLQIVGTTERQWNGTIYDFDSLDTSNFDGVITANHSQNIQEVIGRVVGFKKDPNTKRILMNGIKFALKNPLGRLAKDLMTDGFLTGFSCETIGPDPDESGTWKNHSLCGLSLVVHPNDKKGYAVVANSLENSRKAGLDTTVYEKEFEVEINAQDAERMARVDNLLSIL